MLTSIGEKLSEEEADEFLRLANPNAFQYRIQIPFNALHKAKD